jgi:hypothetical protein
VASGPTVLSSAAGPWVSIQGGVSPLIVYIPYVGQSCCRVGQVRTKERYNFLRRCRTS